MHDVFRQAFGHHTALITYGGTAEDITRMLRQSLMAKGLHLDATSLLRISINENIDTAQGPVHVSPERQNKRAAVIGEVKKGK